MKKAALLVTVNCRQLQSGLKILEHYPFVVFGARDASALRRASELLPKGVRVYLYETG